LTVKQVRAAGQSTIMSQAGRLEGRRESGENSMNAFGGGEMQPSFQNSRNVETGSLGEAVLEKQAGSLSRTQTIVWVLACALLGGLLGALNVPLGAGFKFHLFPIFIFGAAMLGGPWGGALTGVCGSLFSAVTLGNPYLIGGNLLLGLMLGVFLKRGWGVVLSVFLSALIQFAWIWVTDVYLMGLSGFVVGKIILALVLSHTCWAGVIYWIHSKQRRTLA
jgi:hypothetical protein